ncbi:MAG TPA: alpha/beta hydrolase domain-containing protein [Roseiarcus sp.]|nr:alpha/beta hydrolase domain-containing protein [Roseiarcus sp.]
MRWDRLSRAALGAGSFLLGVAPPAHARITRIEIAARQSPTFEGTSFGAAGQYEKLAGRFFGEVDPADPLNASIADIRLAPRNARGMVEYSGVFLIIRPVDPAKGNQRLLFEINNRGNILSFGLLNDAPKNSNDPSTAADAGNGFMMRQGYTLVSAAWDAVSGTRADIGGGPFLLDAPIARNPDGSDIVGPSLEEFVIDDDRTSVARLTYPAADLDTGKAVLTFRARPDEQLILVPADQWRYGPDGTTISLLPEGTKFKPGELYELVYPATKPKVAGLGFAATRDLAAFLRYAEADDAGHPNPLAGAAQHVYTICVSQPCRFMRDFVALGFNEDDDAAPDQNGPPLRRKVVDGMLNWVGGASGVFLNYRFAQPFRTHRQHIGRLYPEFQFPFAYQTTTDSVSGKTDGRLRRCSADAACPKIIEANSDSEYWAKDGALAEIDTQGRDLPEATDVRNYLLVGRPHGDGIPATGSGICQMPRNPLVGNAALRALLTALDAWVSENVEPPVSMVPRVHDGTLVGPVRREVGFPEIPGAPFSGRMHEGDLLDFGPQASEGILTVLPPRRLGSPYPALVPKTDADGNSLAGVRLPDIAAPVATYTGWNLRKNPPDEGCDASGMILPFARTKAERIANGDPRLSLEERYPDHDAYVRAVSESAQNLERRRLLLKEDVERYIRAAEDSDIGR